MIELLWIAALLVASAWSWAGMVMSFAEMAKIGAPGLARRVYLELKPFYWPAVAGWAFADSVIYGTLVDGWRMFALACFVTNWFLHRNLDDHDDRWKRRREKLAAKVAVDDGRLTVVPVSGGAS